MFTTYNEETLLFLLQANPDDFFHYLSHTAYKEQLKCRIRQETSGKYALVSAISNKGIFAASMPVDLLWVLIGLNLVSMPLLVPLALFTLFAASIIAWYVMISSKDEKIKAESDLIKEKFSLEIKGQMLIALHKKITNELSLEREGRNKKSHDNQYSFHVPDFQQVKQAGKNRILKSGYTSDDFLKTPFNLQLPPLPEKPVPYGLFVLSFAIVSTLLATFFWGSIDISAALGLMTLSAGLLNPITIAVVAAVAVGVGLYISYQRYSYQKHIMELKNNIQELHYHNTELFSKLCRDKMCLRELKACRKNAKAEGKSVSCSYPDGFSLFSFLHHSDSKRKEKPKPFLPLKKGRKEPIYEPSSPWLTKEKRIWR